MTNLGSRASIALRCLAGENVFPSVTIVKYILLLYHVEVGEGCPGSPVDGPSFDRLDPQVVGEHQGKYGNTLHDKK